MRKLFILVGLLFVFVAFTNAQKTTKRDVNLTPAVTESLLSLKAANTPATNGTLPLKRCGTAESYAYLMAHDPQYKAAREQFEQNAEAWMKNNPNYDPKTVTTIPVVVHIIYKAAAENISDARVLEQINATNVDYAGGNTHSMYSFAANLKANANIQFCLATTDPTGAATTGITRTLTTKSSFNITGSAANSTGYPERSAATGGCTAWDVTKYFNVWVCNAGSQLCGISLFPTSPISSYYGTTIHYQFFGKTGATAPYNLGGTFTHESGHCLNLGHIWGDDSGGCTQTSFQVGSDACADTPNQADCFYGSHEGGNLSQTGGSSSATIQTDGCTTTSPGVMYQNFMDYTDDIDYACFTPNQVTRMQATLAGADLSLTTSTACGTAAAPVAAFTASATAVTVGTTVTFTDQSTNTPTSWLWTLAPTTGFTYAVGTSASQNPHITFNTVGTYSVTLKATNATGNNSITKTSYISVTAVTAAPVAAFTASATAVNTGATVTLTDQSTNTPTSWLWTLAPTTGFTYAVGTSASQNPQITFNTAGSYSVTLKATNGVGNNSLTKTNYIVVSTGTTTCDTLYPPTSLLACGDSLTYYGMGTSGYVTGNDTYGDLEDAQRYINTNSGTISKVIVGEKAIKAATGTASTYVKLYSVNATTKAPSTLLGTSNAVAMSAISTSGAFVSYTFATPIAITGSFYASLVLPTVSGDTLVVYSTKTTCNSGDSLAWQKWSDGTWYAFVNPANFTSKPNFDLAIYPVICTTVTGTQEFAINNAQFNMYPNPANDKFTVDFAGTERTDVSINVYNLVGELVRSVTPSSATDKVVIDMSDLKAGVYLVRVKTPEFNSIKKLSLIK
jgi:PKD repeat protein